MNSSGRCWTCADDDAEERREWRAWREYVDRQQGMLGAIAEVAPVVCSKLELELLALDLQRWPDVRLAQHFDVTIDTVKSWREAAHGKIRAGIDEASLVERSRRRRQG